MNGDELADNSIDELPGVFDYSYSGTETSSVNAVLIKSISVMVLASLWRSFC